MLDFSRRIGKMVKEPKIISDSAYENPGLSEANGVVDGYDHDHDVFGREDNHDVLLQLHNSYHRRQPNAR